MTTGSSTVRFPSFCDEPGTFSFFPRLKRGWPSMKKKRLGVINSTVSEPLQQAVVSSCLFFFIPHPKHIFMLRPVSVWSLQIPPQGWDNKRGNVPAQPDMPVLSNVITGGLRMAKNLSKAGRKRIPMTPKMGNKNFYKGVGATKEGHISSRGQVSFPYIC